MNSVAQALSIAVQARVPVALKGLPGMGKTRTVEAVVRSLGWNVHTMIASIRDPSDFGGVPVNTPEGIEFLPMRWARTIVRDTSGVPWVVFLDEINTAPVSVQAALLRVVLDRVVGDEKLPDHVSFVACYNPPEVSAGGIDLTPALANRFCHLEWQRDPREWTTGFLAGWPDPVVPRLPPDWESHLQTAKVLVASFINSRPMLLHDFPKTEDRRSGAWPSDRMWDMASRLIAATDSVSAGAEVRTMLIAGCVGEGAAVEFVKWEKTLDLIDPDLIIANPGKYPVPDRSDVAFALVTSVAIHGASLIKSTTKKEKREAIWKNVWTYLGMAVDSGGADLAAAAVKLLSKGLETQDGKSIVSSLPLPEQLDKFVPLLKMAGMYK